MPIYEYACQKCGHAFDVLQKVSDSALRKCPECGALRLKRLVSAPQFRLKGTGWYETDFKQDKKKRIADTGDGAGAGADTAAAKDGSTAKADKPESKEPAAKKDEAVKKKPAASPPAAD